MSEAHPNLFFVLPGAGGQGNADVGAVGSKAWGLMRLAQLGVRVPPAFVLGTAVCRDYLAHGRLPAAVEPMLGEGLARLAEATGRRFGDARRPLLLAVRSGAPVSMPGMMETILNVGLCDHNLGGFLRATGNPRLVRDCYRRLVCDFAEIVHGGSAATFAGIAEALCREQGVAGVRELDSAGLAALCAETLHAAHAMTGQRFPQAPMDQLTQAVEAVFRSWNSDKARHYRRLNGIDDAIGTAVTIQAMVFGNSGSNSGAGVGFTRDPATGADGLYVDFLFNAQGEDVVSGRQAVHGAEQLSRRLPMIWQELQRIKGLLEHEFHDMQDFEFTVEAGRLHLLQTRGGKRTPWAAVQMAVDMVREGLLTRAEALARLRPYDLGCIGRTRVAGGVSPPQPLAAAIPASIGVAQGILVFDPRRVGELAAQGLHVILARPEIATGDIEGIAAADGVLTAAGGRTSHAAVVARQLGKVCLVGCSALTVAAGERSCVIAGQHLGEGEPITLDGDRGLVYRGLLPLVRERPEQALAEIAGWG